MSLTVITPPTLEPVSLEEAKLHLRVDHDEQDDEIEGWITAAREYCETFTNRAFITQTLQLTLDDFPRVCGYGDRVAGRLWIPRAPLQTVSLINYYAADGTVTALSHSTAIQIDTGGVGGQGSIFPAVNTTWPTVQSGRINGVTIQFQAGYGDEAADVPGKIKQAMKLLIGHYNEHREGVIVGTIASDLPQAVNDLLWTERIVNFAERAA